MKKILPVDITQFINEVAMLLQSGLSIEKALKIVQIEQDKSAMDKLIGDIQTNLADGMSLADSWAKYPQYFEPFLVESLKQGENLAIRLAQIAQYREKMEENEMDLIHEMEFPMAYLMSVFTIFVIISSILLIYVMPVFMEMFDAFGIQLPAATEFLFIFSDFVLYYWWIILSGGLSLGILLRLKWQTVKLYLPLFGRFYQKLALVRCLHTLAFTLSQKVPLSKAFEAAAQVVNNSVYAKLLQQASQKMLSSSTLPDTLSPFFTKKVFHVMMIGTHTNQFEKLLTKLADLYTKQLHQMIGPIVRKYQLIGIILIAVLVGIFVISMYLPIFMMGQGL